MNAREFWVQHQKEPVAGVSKYALLRDALVDAIASGDWKRGAQLPTEQELARETPFSLGTVQRALRGLVDDGIIIRRQGFGTFVADDVKPLNKPWHMRFVSPDGDEVVETYTYVLDRQNVRKKGRWSRYFPNKTDLFVIERRFRIVDKFWVFNRFYGSAGNLGQNRRTAGQGLVALLQDEHRRPLADELTQRLCFRVVRPGAGHDRQQQPLAVRAEHDSDVVGAGEVTGTGLVGRGPTRR